MAGIDEWDERWVAGALASGDLDQRDELGVTPVWHAVYFSKPAWVTRLLDAGADPNADSGPGLMKCPVWKRLSGVYGCHMDQQIQSLACSEKQPRSGIAELLIRTRQC